MTREKFPLVIPLRGNPLLVVGGVSLFVVRKVCEKIELGLYVCRPPGVYPRDARLPLVPPTLSGRRTGARVFTFLNTSGPVF